MTWDALLARGEQKIRHVTEELPKSRAMQRWQRAREAAELFIGRNLPLSMESEPPTGFWDVTREWEFAIRTPLTESIMIYFMMQYDVNQGEWISKLYYAPSGMPANFVVPVFEIVREIKSEGKQIERLPREHWCYAASLEEAAWYAKKSFDSLTSLRSLMGDAIQNG